MSPAQTKLDLFKLHRAEYVAPKEPKLLSILGAQYLTIYGDGPALNGNFDSRLNALIQVAMATRDSVQSTNRSYVLGKIEASPGCSGNPSVRSIALDRWKLMMRTPNTVCCTDVTRAIGALVDQGVDPLVRQVTLERAPATECVQMLYSGPQDGLAALKSATVRQLWAFADSNNLQISGFPHVIFLSDPKRVPPEHARTILRVAVRMMPGLALSGANGEAQLRPGKWKSAEPNMA